MKIIIEMPKGDSRRRHIKPDKSGFIDLGPIKEVIPINEGIIPVNYGYIPGTLNKNEGDEVDVLVLSENTFIVGQEIEVKPIALIRRADGDDKIVAVDNTKNQYKRWQDIPMAERGLIENFFSFHHKIIFIDSAEEAMDYIKQHKN